MTLGLKGLKPRPGIGNFIFGVQVHLQNT